MAEIERLAPIYCRKTFNQFEKLLDTVWVQKEIREENPLSSLSDETLFSYRLQRAINSNQDVIRIVVTEMNNQMISSIAKLIGREKRVYIIAKENDFNSKKELYRNIAGRALIRGIKTLLPDLLVIGNGTDGVCSFSPGLFLSLNGEQCLEAASWFNWFFWKEAAFEVASLEEMDLPNTNPSSPYEPIYPSLNQNLTFSKNFPDVHSELDTCLSSRQEVISQITKGDRLILNGIDNIMLKDCGFGIIEGIRHEMMLPDIIIGREATHLHETYENYHLIIRCDEKQKSMIDRLLNNYSSPYKLENEVELGSIENGFSIKVHDNWYDVVSSEKISLDPVKVDDQKEKKEMENIRPLFFPSHPPNVKNVEYEWEVLPPILPEGSSLHKLNEEWEKFNEKMTELIEENMKKINAIQNKSGSMKKVLNFIRGKLSNNESEAQVLKSNLNVLNDKKWIDQTENIKNEYERLKYVIEKIDNLWNRQESEISTEERRIEEEEQRKEYDERKNKLIKELDELKSELEQGDDITKKERKKIKKKMKSLEKKIGEPFVYKTKSTIKGKTHDKKKRSIVSYLKSSKKEILPSIPQKSLPEFGILYQHKNYNYLCVYDWESVPGALNESKHYWNAKVVSAK